MFGEYAQIASFINTRDGLYGGLYGQDAMPEYLRPDYQPSQPWGASKDKSGLTDDFIMIAEFSELEGPKPLMTIPKDGAGSSFDQNSFAVRILAVDHQTSSCQGFSISEDAQVVLSDVDAGVFAFVHHMVLYDNTARGFVRPHCMAYITTDQRKLMRFYEEMSSQFKKVARYIKYGNLLLFVADLERHLKDLDHTKGFLLNQVSKQRLKETDVNSDMRKNADNELHRKLQTIHQSMSDIKDILSILKPLLSDKRLEARFQLLEERAFRAGATVGGDKLSLQEDWFNDLTVLDEIDGTRIGSLNEPQTSFLSLFQPRDYKPLLVETKKAKRFNTPLRGLHELSSWGAKEGLRKLRCLHNYFKRDLVVLELEKLESKLMRPSFTGIFHGQCVTGNLLTGIQMKLSSPCLDQDEDMAMLQHSFWASNTSLESDDSFKSMDSCASAAINNISPKSCHTIDSFNCHFYQSATSSLDKHDISLMTEHEYYEEVPNEKCDGDPKGSMKSTETRSDEDHCHSDDKTEEFEDKDDKCKHDVLHTQTVSSFDEIKQRIYMEESIEPEEPPIIVFKEKIQRPLSVVSLGCTDDENDSDQGSGMTMEEVMKGNTSSVADSNVFANGDSAKERKILEHEESNGTEKKDEQKENKENVEKDETHNKNLDIEISLISNEKGRSPDENDSGLKTENSNKSASNDVKVATDDVNKNLKLPQLSVVPGKGSDDVTVLNSKIDSKCHHNNVFTSELSHSSSTGDLKGQQTRNTCPSNEPRGQSILSANSQKYNMFGFRKSFRGSQIFIRSHNDASTKSSTSPSTATSSSSSSSISSPTTSQPEPIFIHRDEKTPTNLEHAFSSSSSTTNNNKGDAMLTRSSSSSSSLTASIPQRPSSNTVSSGQSDFTEISIRELFPYLNDGNSVVSSALDIQSTCDLCEQNDGFEGLVGGFTASNIVSSWRPRHGLYTLGDWINNLKSSHAGYGILDVLNGYTNLQHVICSLMIGRPVLVVGVAKLEPEVLKVVNALSVFIPSTKRRQQHILEWTSKHLRISDLSKLRLIGLCRDERKSLDLCVPSPVKKACTILDVEKRVILAPQYQGQLIGGLLAKRKTFKSDAVMLSYIHWWLMDILGKSFIFFHSFYLGSAGTMISSSNLREHRDSYRATVTGIMGRLGIKDSDCSIVERLAELAKLSRLEPSIPQKVVNSGNGIQPLSIHFTPCQTYKC